MKLRHIIAALALTLAPVPTMAQDLLARQAPVDRRMKSIDSISLHRMLPMMYELQDPSGDLYPEWSNKTGRNYGAAMPKEFKIDLRHFCMPCDSRLVTSHYGWREQFGRKHYGTDIKLYTGDTVRAAFSGKVRVVSYEAGGYGNYVILRHNNGLETVYGHMSKHLVKENQTVRAGEPIGLGGNTGRSTGSHLHFETRFLGEYIDPEKMFDFQAQDAKGDYYVYRNNGGSRISGDSHHSESPVNLIANKHIVKRDEVAAATTDEKVTENSKDEKLLAKADKTDKADKKKKKSTRQKREEVRTYSVKEGDTLYGIATKNGMTVDKLCKANGIKESSVLYPGQKLKLNQPV